MPPPPASGVAVVSPRSILALDLGSRCGWAVLPRSGRIASGVNEFRPGRFEGAGMAFLRFERFLGDAADTSGPFGVVVFEEVRAHAGTLAAQVYGGFLAHLTAWCERHAVPYLGVPVATIMRDIMDALSPSHPARRIVFMSGAQLGKTEAGNNWIGYCIHQAPGPFLAVQPTTELAKRLSQQRIEPLIEESPELREIVMPARARDSGNTVLAKRFVGGQLVLTGAKSAVGLRSMPARWLFLDEVDAYPGDVEGEGDPVALAEARTRTFGHRRKVFMVSTPTIKGLTRIEREYEASDQRRYFVPCPHCAPMQWLKFERLIWEKGNPETAQYVCENCETGIAEHHKTAMLAAGEWRATAECPDPHVIGFHISGLYTGESMRRPSRPTEGRRGT